MSRADMVSCNAMKLLWEASLARGDSVPISGDTKVQRSRTNQNQITIDNDCDSSALEGRVQGTYVSSTTAVAATITITTRNVPVSHCRPSCCWPLFQKENILHINRQSRTSRSVCNTGWQWCTFASDDGLWHWGLRWFTGNQISRFAQACAHRVVGCVRHLANKQKMIRFCSCFFFR